ncbi:filament-like plant protein 7 [Cryptomeria japonica]|uniref:filament-like plant protein 7 n=1 Tax=Cryptomeria japonica TaxID=3369 RepID=UPI0027DA6DA2|nr:filament-like plant protein 7 [Cryptomeria japonica]XP_057863306.2 filament-like plant protein 7 [Cryptomeria japonica]XP_057863307.2 filament-like plant protein 7 [Cryptomeria japonica]XP_057863309.2 filament-like plant protein 7 [Cryptomeria japonica]XP_057863310.2 filament-like plant protein 7 [Cryptomeria japonica]
MDRRNWLWRRKSLEKTVSTVDQADTLPAERACEEQDLKSAVTEYSDETTNQLMLSNNVKDLRERLAAALAESNAKDDLVKQHAKVAEEAVSGWEKAREDAVSLKQELDAARQQKVAAEDRVSHLDGALKECMRQLRHVREEQEQAIHDVVMKKARELDMIQQELEAKLAETNRRLLEMGAENSALHKSLQEWMRQLDEVREGKIQAEAEVSVSQIRLRSLEEENASVKYEICVLEKELEIRNEEKEYNRKSADAANRQHSESMKKIAKLETECQRLRVLVRKKLPGPAAVAQMRMEVETLSKDTAEWKRKRLNARKGGLGSVSEDQFSDSAQENSIKQIQFLSERLFSMEAETEILKNTIAKRNSELQASRVMCARTANKLSKVESQLDGLCKENGISRINGTATDGHMDLSKYVKMTSEPSLASISEDGGNEDEASCAESWATALISELAHFKKEKPSMLKNKVLESPEFDLMDDFIEMERLATVSSEKQEESPTFSGKTKELSGSHTELKTNKNGNTLPIMDKKVPLEESPTKREADVLVAKKHKEQTQQSSTFESRMPVNELAFSSTQEILHMILNTHAKGKNMDEVLENVKAAITASQHSDSEQISKIKEKLTCLKVLSTPGFENGSLDEPISGQFSPQSPSEGNSSEDEISPFSCSKHNKEASVDSKLNASIHKILELIEGFVHSNSVENAHSENMPLNSTGSLPIQNSISVPGYSMRVLQWQNSELNSLIQSLAKVCSDLLQGKADIVEFVEKISFALDWIVNHFFSLQDVSSMRAIIKKQLAWDDELHSGSESEGHGGDSPTFGQGKSKRVEKGQYENQSITSTLAAGASELNLTSNDINKVEVSQKLISDKESLEHHFCEENNKLKVELTILQSEKQELEAMFQLANKNIEALKSQLLESEKKIEDLQKQLIAIKELKLSLEKERENHISMNEELEFQLKAARAELYQFQEKFTSLQAELEEKGSCFQELEATCLDLQLQLESGGKDDNSKDENTALLSESTADEQKRLKKEREILAANKKLAECQQTILTVEKQLKALASPSKAKDISLQSPSVPHFSEKTTPSVNTHASLLDRMQAETIAEESQDCVADEGSQDCVADKSTTKDVLCSGTEKEDSYQESSTPRNGKTGLFYGWQMPSESSSIGGHKHEKNVSGGNAQSETTMTSPVSPAKFFSMKLTNSGSESPKDSNADVTGSASPKKRSHGGAFSRFLRRKKKGY